MELPVQAMLCLATLTTPQWGESDLSFSTAPGIIFNVELAIIITMFYW